jgi:predicted DNA repair protein MutK
VLIAMSVVMTVGIYGLIAALVRLDDIGLALVRAPDAARQAMGRRIVWAAPRILGALGPIGMVAMLAVAGGIFTHLVHFKAPHWALGMAIDIAVGAIVGVALAAAGAGFQRLVSRTA